MHHGWLVTVIGVGSVPRRLGMRHLLVSSSPSLRSTYASAGSDGESFLQRSGAPSIIPSVLAKTERDVSERRFLSPSWVLIMEEGSRKSPEGLDRVGELSNTEENPPTGSGQESGISVSSIWTNLVITGCVAAHVSRQTAANAKCRSSVVSSELDRAHLSLARATDVVPRRSRPTNSPFFYCLEILPSTDADRHDMIGRSKTCVVFFASTDPLAAKARSSPLPHRTTIPRKGDFVAKANNCRPFATAL
jgi:hypothetical protein